MGLVVVGFLFVAEGEAQATDEFLRFAFGEVGGGVQENVDVHGHFAFLHGLGGFICFVAALAPLGDVEFFAAFFYVVGDKPGDGSDVAVPGPEGFVAVTIGAGTEEEFAGPGAVPGGFGDYGRVGVISSEGDELKGEHYEYEGAETSEDEFGDEGARGFHGVENVGQGECPAQVVGMWGGCV